MMVVMVVIDAKFRVIIAEWSMCTYVCLFYFTIYLYFRNQTITSDPAQRGH